MANHSKNETLNQKIGFRIYQARRRKGFTCLVLAERSGLHRNTVSRAESGYGITVYALARIAHALDASLDVLVPYSPTLVHCELIDDLHAEKAATVVSESVNRTGSLFSPARPATVR